MKHSTAKEGAVMSVEQTTKSKREQLDDDIDMLCDKADIFCLRALMLAGHVSETAMRAVVDLSNTVRHD